MKYSSLNRSLIVEQKKKKKNVLHDDSFALCRLFVPRKAAYINNTRYNGIVCTKLTYLYPLCRLACIHRYATSGTRYHVTALRLVAYLLFLYIIFYYIGTRVFFPILGWVRGASGWNIYFLNVYRRKATTATVRVRECFLFVFPSTTQKRLCIYRRLFVANTRTLKMFTAGRLSVERPNFRF